jgi:hypothetical protein
VRLWRKDHGDLTVMEDPGVTSSVNMHTYAKPKERLGISHVIRNIIGTGSYVSIHYLTLLEKNH